MFERFTENARRALFFARYQATEVGSLTITTEALLLGVVRADRPMVARVLGSSASPEDISRDVERRITMKDKISTSVEIPFDTAAKHVLQYAAEEAHLLAHSHIGTEHLLLGTLREGTSGAAAVLAARGLQLDGAREAVATLVADDAVRSVIPEAAEAGMLIRGLHQLLDRLSTLAADNAAARGLLDEIRQRVGKLEQQLKARPE
jgi:ATP-dependent Clp protease ATP-binding subunit ClpC